MTTLAKTIVKNLDIKVLYEEKTRSSLCWKYFGNIVRNEDGKKKILNPDQVYCSVCLRNVIAESDEVLFGSVKIRSYSKTVSTGNLIRHLRDDHDIRDEPARPKTPKSPKPTIKIKIERSPTESYTAFCSNSNALVRNDKWQLARDLALWFSKSLLPFDSVSDEGMVDFFMKYNVIPSEDDFPSRNTVGGSALTDVYEYMLNNVKEVIQLHVPRHCSIAFDLWTDRYRKLNYITFRLHYLTADFELKSLTLSTHVVREKKTGEEISDLIKDLQTKFGLEGKSIHAVIDAGSNVRQAVAFENMSHHLCLGHGLHNLVTIDGIQSVPEINEVVKKCKKIVKTLRYRLPELEFEAKMGQNEFICALDSVAETLEMDEIEQILCNEVEDPSETSEGVLEDSGEYRNIPSAKTDTPTRWHSVLEMLEFLINLCNRDIVNDMLKRINHETLTIKQNEWDILEDLVKFLDKFREVVEILSSQKTCTINVALVFRSELLDVLKSLSDDESSIMFRLKHNMLANIDKRFPITRPLIAAALLDKRFVRLKEVDFYLESRNLTKVSFLTSYIKELIQSDDLHPESRKNTSKSSSAPVTNTTSILNKLSKKHSISDGTEDPLDQECWRYLAMGSTELPSDDLLSFWKENISNFPWLSSFARALLCIPATSTPSERVFSAAGLIITAKRSRLDPFRVNKVIFIHDNYDLNKGSTDN